MISYMISYYDIIYDIMYDIFFVNKMSTIFFWHKIMYCKQKEKISCDITYDIII